MLSRERGNVRLIAIPAGIPSHADLSCAALEAGYDVVCEKPVAGCLADALRMLATHRETGGILAIGFQTVFTAAVQRLKALRLSGALGDLVEARSLARWPRGSDYYRRNEWAGRLMLGSRSVHDSPAHNATAHYLNLMLYVAGTAADDSAVPAEIYGENYRVKDIESADTQFLRIRTSSGVRITFITSHATPRVFGPEGFFRFDRGTVRYRTLDGGSLVFSIEGDGRVPPHLDPTEEDPGRAPGKDDSRSLVFRDTIEAVREGRAPLCTVANAIQQTQCVEVGFQSSGGVRVVDRDDSEDLAVEKDEAGRVGSARSVNTVIRGIEELTDRMYEDGASYSEVGAPWAVRAAGIAVSHDILT